MVKDSSISELHRELCANEEKENRKQSQPKKYRSTQRPPVQSKHNKVRLNRREDNLKRLDANRMEGMQNLGYCVICERLQECESWRAQIFRYV